MKTTSPVSLRNILFGVMVVGALSVAPAGWSATTISDNFNDGNDTAPPIAWQRFDPIGDYMSAGPYAHWSFPTNPASAGNYAYRILADPTPDINLGPGRGLSLAPGNFTSFYASVDVINWDETVHQVFGILARVGTPGLGQTSGYLFNWDNGNPPTSTSGDMDIVRVDSESPTDLDSNTFFGNDSVHLITGHSYRFVFMGVSNVFRGQVYDLTNTVVPIVDYGVTDPAYDPSGADHVSGPMGLIVANNGDGNGADATFDNFLATDGELLSGSFPLLRVAKSAPGSVQVTWPLGGTWTLHGSPGLASPPASAAWGPSLTPTSTNGAENVYTVSPATGNQFFKLAVP